MLDLSCAAVATCLPSGYFIKEENKELVSYLTQQTLMSDQAQRQFIYICPRSRLMGEAMGHLSIQVTTLLPQPTNQARLVYWVGLDMAMLHGSSQCCGMYLLSWLVQQAQSYQGCRHRPYLPSGQIPRGKEVRQRCCSLGLRYEVRYHMAMGSLDLGANG